jgi:hypothetical protein
MSDLTVAEAVVRHYLLGTLSGGAEAAFDRIIDALTAAEARIVELEAWKRGALDVESDWNPQSVADVLGVSLGVSIRGNLLPAARALLDRTLAAEARIEAALAVLERKVKSWDDVKEAAAILRGDHDTKGERL